MSKQPGQNTGAGGPAGAPEGAEAAKPEQYGTFRLDALGVSGTEALIEAPSKRRLPVQMIVLLVLVSVAGGALYAMRRLGMGPISAIAEVKIDYEQAKGTAADHRKLLADLNSNHVERQVPAEQVQKNPFRLPELHAGPEEPGNPEKPTDDRDSVARRLAKERQDKIDSALATLKVHTVLSGTTPVARVGDENVRVGDMVLNLFTVTAIGGRTVDLTVDGQTFTLSLDDDVQGKSTAKPRPQPKAPTPKKK